MERQEEYELKQKIADAIDKDVDHSFEIMYKATRGRTDTAVLFPISIVERAFSEASLNALLLGMDDFETMLLVNPLRNSVAFFIRRVIQKQKKIRFSHLQLPNNLEEAADSFSKKVLTMFENHEKAEQIRLMRSSKRVRILTYEEGKYSLEFPRINDSYSKELVYYYGLDDPLAAQNEKQIIIECEKYLVDKFDVTEVINPKAKNIQYARISFMERKIDVAYYDECKKRVAIDIDKISSGKIASRYFETEEVVIESKEELISVVALFYYLSRVCQRKYALTAGCGDPNPIYYCAYDEAQLVNLGKEIGIKRERILAYIKYWSMTGNEGKATFNEFPLIKMTDKIVWIPSSFVLNDFQFSIVNGHYYKNVIFYEKDETVSQSIVDYIVSHAQRFSNLLVNSNYLYHVEDEKFKGKDLKSDIDVALFDTQSNTLLIIECKWKENVYPGKDDYKAIEKALKDIYDNQLEKHQFYLEGHTDRLNSLFSDKVDFSTITNLKIMYLFVDKRIQYHENDKNRHAIPIFILAHLFENHSTEDCLALDKVVYDIAALESTIEYEQIKLTTPVQIDEHTCLF